MPSVTGQGLWQCPSMGVISVVIVRKVAVTDTGAQWTSPGEFRVLVSPDEELSSGTVC